MSKRPSISDVARRAGVSPTTVSFVLTGREGVASATRERVREAIDELGYQPSVAAQSLRTGRTGSIGFIADDIATSPFAGATIAGAHDEARRRGLTLLVAHTGGDADQELAAVEELLRRGVDGFVLASIKTREAALPEGLLSVPATLLNCFPPQPGPPAIIPDEQDGGRRAMEALLQHGHRDVAMIRLGEDGFAVRERMAGARRALSEHGLDPDAVPVHVGDGTPYGGHQATVALLAAPQPPTALMCFNDRTALGAYMAAKERGLVIPEDLSIVGYDDQPELAAYLHPPLTTVALPHLEMGREAIVRLLDGQRQGGTARVGCPLIERASVVPPCTGDQETSTPEPKE